MALQLLNVFMIAGLLAPAPRIDGVALSLYYENPQKGMTFKKMVDEIADLGASHVSILVQWSQKDTKSSLIQPHPKETPADALVSKVIRHARSKGLKVMLFPILWVEERAIGDWRGTLKPEDPDAWWSAYNTFILHYAKLAQATGAVMFSIGSELGSMESETARWRHLSAKVRGLFKGQLVYSANWDHYQHVTFWDAVDFIGMTAYYRLTMTKQPSLDELTASWSRVRLQLLDWYEGQTKPLLFTELGYPSVDGAAMSPWDYTSAGERDLEEQRLCFEAFKRVWHGEERLSGVFFWNWWGPGDGLNTWYTLKGKPALKVVKSWMQTGRVQE